MDTFSVWHSLDTLSVSVKCQQIIDVCSKQHNMSSQHSSLWQITCICQLAVLPPPCGLPLHHSALQFFHSARKNGKLPIFEDKESIVRMLHPRRLYTHIQCKYPTVLQPCMGWTHNVYMIVVPLTSGAHWHGGCPPAPSREKHCHCWQQDAQHSSHSVRMVTKKEGYSKAFWAGQQGSFMSFMASEMWGQVPYTQSTTNPNQIL